MKISGKKINHWYKNFLSGFVESEKGKEETDKLFEKYAFATLKESNILAKERGEYELFRGSDWEKGILFGRKKEWYTQHTENGKDWSDLIDSITKDGLRFSYHLAPAPNTSTAGVVGTTAGLLPIYKRLFVETNSIAPVVNVAPQLSQKNFWFYKEYQRIIWV